MSTKRDELVKVLSSAIKRETAAEARFDKLPASRWKARNLAQDRFLAARRARMEAERVLGDFDAYTPMVHAAQLRDRNEMRDLLKNSGYDPRDAERLQAEGMGPFELKDRLRHVPGSMGSLGYTHGLKWDGPAELDRAIAKAIRRGATYSGADIARAHDNLGNRHAASINGIQFKIEQTPGSKRVQYGPMQGRRYDRFDLLVDGHKVWSGEAVDSTPLNIAGGILEGYILHALTTAGMKRESR